jgi:hypothetical protein
MAHVRPVGGKVVLVATEWYHKHGVHQGRQCDMCGARWTVLMENGQFQVWRNNQPSNEAIIDYVGNNVAVECCEKRQP